MSKIIKHTKIISELLSFIKNNISSIMILFNYRKYIDSKLLRNCHNDIIELMNTHYIKQIGMDDIQLFFNEDKRRNRISLNTRLNGIKVNTPCVTKPEMWYEYLTEFSAYSEIGDIDSARKIMNNTYEK